MSITTPEYREERYEEFTRVCAEAVAKAALREDGLVQLAFYRRLNLEAAIAWMMDLPAETDASGSYIREQVDLLSERLRALGPEGVRP